MDTLKNREILKFLPKIRNIWPYIQHPEIQFRERTLGSLLAPESPPPACLHVGGAYQRFLFFFVPLDQAPHHVLITLLHFLHFYSSLPSLFVSHGEWRYCFSIFNSFYLFLFTINLKKLLSRKNYKYSLDNFVSYKKISKLFLRKFFIFCISCINNFSVLHLHNFFSDLICYTFL